MPNRSEDIDRMVASSHDWRGSMLAKLRRLIHAADPKITEAVKWKRPGNPKRPAVFDRNGIVCIRVLLTERVRLVLGKGASDIMRHAGSWKIVVAILHDPAPA